jgi:hypothetical protein
MNQGDQAVVEDEAMIGEEETEGVLSVIANEGEDKDETTIN